MILGDTESEDGGVRTGPSESSGFSSATETFSMGRSGSQLTEVNLRR